MEVAERELQVRRFVDEVWNGRNCEAAADLYSENYSNPFGVGPEARIEPIRRYRETFPDLHLDVHELIVAGDTVVSPERLACSTWRPPKSISDGESNDP